MIPDKFSPGDIVDVDSFLSEFGNRSTAEILERLPAGCDVVALTSGAIMVAERKCLEDLTGFVPKFDRGPLVFDECRRVFLWGPRPYDRQKVRNARTAAEGYGRSARALPSYASNRGDDGTISRSDPRATILDPSRRFRDLVPDFASVIFVLFAFAFILPAAILVDAFKQNRRP